MLRGSGVRRDAREDRELVRVLPGHLHDRGDGEGLLGGAVGEPAGHELGRRLGPVHHGAERTDGAPLHRPGVRGDRPDRVAGPQRVGRGVLVVAQQLERHPAAQCDLPVGRRQPRRDRIRVGHDRYPQPLGTGQPAVVPFRRPGTAEGKDRLVREEQELARGAEKLFARRRRANWLEAAHQHTAHGPFERLDALAHG